MKKKVLKYMTSNKTDSVQNVFILINGFKFNNMIKLTKI